jgi:DeoR family transcriptional regulator of aga operon
MAEYAEQVVVVADHSKLGVVSRARLLPLTGVSTLITGRQATEDQLRALTPGLVDIRLV